MVVGHITTGTPVVGTPVATTAASAPIASSDAAAGLTPSERVAFNRDGFVLVKGAATREQTERAQRAMYHQLGMSATEPDGWYTTPPHATPSPFQHISNYAGCSRLLDLILLFPGVFEILTRHCY